MLRRSVGTEFYSLAVQNAVCIQRIFFVLFCFVLTNGKQIIDLDFLQGLGLTLNLQVQESHLYGFIVR